MSWGKSLDRYKTITEIGNVKAVESGAVGQGRMDKVGSNTV